MLSSRSRRFREVRLRGGRAVKKLGHTVVVDAKTKEEKKRRGRWVRVRRKGARRHGPVDGEKLLARLDGAEITARPSAECAVALPLVS